jgi:hypothetical protein
VSKKIEQKTKHSEPEKIILIYIRFALLIRTLPMEYSKLQAYLLTYFER